MEVLSEEIKKQKLRTDGFVVFVSEPKDYEDLKNYLNN